MAIRLTGTKKSWRKKKGSLQNRIRLAQTKKVTCRAESVRRKQKRLLAEKNPSGADKKGSLQRRIRLAQEKKVTCRDETGRRKK